MQLARVGSVVHTQGMAPSEVGNQQPFTIFYSGRVNVFDNVPSDKAHAIMLLLSSCSLQTNNLGSSSKTASVHAILDAGYNPKTVETSASSADAAAAASAANASNTIALQLQKKQQTRVRTKRSQAELPFARKASLARFLEKRKGRMVEAMKDIKDALKSGVPDADADECDSPSKKMKM